MLFKGTIVNFIQLSAGDLLRVHNSHILYVIRLVGVSCRDLVTLGQFAIDDRHVGDGSSVLVIPGVKDQSLEGIVEVTLRSEGDNKK